MNDPLGYWKCEKIYEFHAECAKCGDDYTMHWHDRGQVIADARALGWVLGKRVLCPKCSGKALNPDGMLFPPKERIGA